MAESGSDTAPWAGSLLLHPLALASLALWIANDHWLKLALPGALTGKLSDAAGLVVCPLLLLRALEILYPRCLRSVFARRNALYAALGLVALFLVGIKTLDTAAFLYRWGLAAAQWPVRCAIAWLSGGTLTVLRPVTLVRDHSDLWMLPSLLVPWWIARAASPDRDANSCAALGRAPQ